MSIFKLVKDTLLTLISSLINSNDAGASLHMGWHWDNSTLNHTLVWSWVKHFGTLTLQRQVKVGKEIVNFQTGEYYSSADLECIIDKSVLNSFQETKTNHCRKWLRRQRFPKTRRELSGLTFYLCIIWIKKKLVLPLLLQIFFFQKLPYTNV